MHASWVSLVNKYGDVIAYVIILLEHTYLAVLYSSLLGVIEQ